MQPTPETRRRRAACAIALGATLWSAAAAGADELKPYQATYRGIWHGMTVAVSNLRLENSGDTWTYSSKSEGRGLGRLASGLSPDQTSVAKVVGDGIQPQSYRSGGGDARHSIDLKYDWQTKRLTGNYEGTKVDLPLTPGGAGRCLGAARPDERAARRQDARQVPAHRQEQRARVPASRARARRPCKTPLGDVPTVIYRAQKKYSPRTTRFWCAPGKGFIPMKVEQTKGDDVQWTLQIESLKR